MRSSRTSRPLLAALAFATLAACGGGDAGSSSGETVAKAEDPSAAQDTAPPSATAAEAATGDTITIRMVTTQGGAAGQFEPATVTAKSGDVLHFVSDGGAPHNVSWPQGENPAGSTLPAPSAYVMGAGQAVDEAVSLSPGTYTFQCDPHVAMGMKGTLTVTS